MKELDRKLQQVLEDNGIAGMAVAVTDREKVVYSNAFGVDNAERPNIPADPEAIYRIASITKVVSGVMFMRLAEEGLLDIDLPLKNYVPWLDFTSKEALEKMTLRHVMSHTSGLPVEYTPEGPREESALEQTLKDGLPDLEFASMPGDGVFLYSNWGIRLASYIAQLVTGKAYSELARQYVLDPLGMDMTTFDLRTAATYPMSLPHVDDGKGGHKVEHHIKENAARLAAGGLYSNVFDICKLARFILNGGKNDRGERVLSEQSLREMCKAHGSFDKSRGDVYGLTMLMRKYRDGYLCGHHGSAPPYTLVFFTDEESGYGAVIFMNTWKPELRYEIADMIFDHLRDNTDRL